MLTFLREGAKSGVLKFFLVGFMGLAVMGLVFVDMTGSFRDGVSSNSVAKVGDGEISTAQMTAALQNAERQTGMIDIPQQMREALARRVVDQEIQRRIYALEAQDIGLIVPEEKAAQQIKSQLEPLVQGGLTDEDALAQLLRSTGMSERQLMRAYQQDMAVNLLVQSITGGTYAPSEMVEIAYKYQNQKRAGDVLKIEKSAFKDKIGSASDSDLKSFYDENLSKYMTPEYREISYMIMSEDDIAQDMDLPDEALKEIYEENIDDYTLPPRRIVDQVVFQSADTAQEVVEQSEDAASLMAALAKQNADDYILLENEAVTEDDASLDLVDAAFDTPVGEITGPIQSSLGWIVMAVKSEEDETIETFESVKEEMRKNVQRDKSEEVFYEAANEIDEMLISGMALSEVADEYKLTVYQTPMLLVSGKTKDGKTAEIMQQKFAEELLQKSFESKTGDIPPLMETADGRFVAFAVTNIEEPQAKPFENVKSSVQNDWLDQKQTDEMVALTGEISEKAKAGTSLKALAKEYSLNLKTYGPVTAKEAVDKKLMAQPLVERLFTLDKIGEKAESIGSDSAEIIELTAIVYPETSELNEDEREKYASAISNRIQGDIQVQYENALREKYDVKISDNAIKRAVAPINEDF